MKEFPISEFFVVDGTGMQREVMDMSSDQGETKNSAESTTVVDGEEPVSNATEKSWMEQLKIHPASALLVIALDTALFGGNAISGGLLTPVSVFLGFCGSFAGVSLIEKFLGSESNGRSVAKGFLLGILTGIPTSIATTAIGALILALGGIRKFTPSRILDSGERRK